MKSYIVTTFARPEYARTGHAGIDALDVDNIPLETVTVLHEDENFGHVTAIASIFAHLAPHGFYKLDEAHFDQLEAIGLLTETFPHNPVLPVVTPAFLQGNQLTAQWTREWRKMLQFIRNKAS